MFFCATKPRCFYIVIVIIKRHLARTGTQFSQESQLPAAVVRYKANEFGVSLCDLNVVQIRCPLSGIV